MGWRKALVSVMALRFLQAMGVVLPCRKRGGCCFAAAMQLVVPVQIVGLAEGLSAARIGAAKGLVAGVGSCVCLQMAALGKGASTAGLPADKGFFSCVNPPVDSQG